MLYQRRMELTKSRRMAEFHLGPVVVVRLGKVRAKGLKPAILLGRRPHRLQRRLMLLLWLWLLLWRLLLPSLRLR